jgi:hypothetical protein
MMYQSTGDVMSALAEEIIRAIKAVAANANVSTTQTSQSVIEALTVRYGNGRGQEGHLWEQLQNDVSVRNPDAWRWIASFVDGHRAILVFDPEVEPSAFEFEHGNEIVSVLAECSGFEFYVTDAERTYLLCFNHHDYLIAAGRAASWLDSETNKNRTTKQDGPA